jgi:chaperone modulatory protein CbpM
MDNIERIEQLSGDVLEDITLAEMSVVCAVQTESIIALVEEDVLTPSGQNPSTWIFTGMHIHRANTALRLQHDLGVNLAGVALALQLLDEIKVLRMKLRN